MIYTEFQKEKLSALGLGCMRLPTTPDGAVDRARFDEMIDTAMAQGINYFDTAWIYHGGTSETEVGRSLGRYGRSTYYLADKFPAFDMETVKNPKATFEEQLRRCGVDYFDFYLFHNVTQDNIDLFLNPEYGVFDYIKAQKEAGRIRHLGFSTHGNFDSIRRFLTAGKGVIEFCQLQINYLDWTYQNAMEKVNICQEFGIPVWVMEPVRGGRLCRLPKSAAEMLKALRPDETPASWCFRFLQSIPGVGMILSGMSDLTQLSENIRTFAECKPLNNVEWDTLIGIGKQLGGTETIPCTACRYCVDRCPNALDIPQLIELYNECLYQGNTFDAAAAFAEIPDNKLPGDCVGCGSCEDVCPQKIKISEKLADFQHRLQSAEKGENK